MHIDFKKTIDNIKLFMTENRKYRITQRPLILRRIEDFSHKDKQFIDESKEIFSDFKCDVDYQLKVKNRTDWLTSVDVDWTSDQLFFPCGAWLDINIFCTGWCPSVAWMLRVNIQLEILTKAAFLRFLNMAF